MESIFIIYILAGAGLAGLLIWGGLEWYAAVLLGFIAPFVGLILSLPITLVISVLVPAPLVGGEARADWVSMMSMVTSQVLVLGGAFLVARSMRQEKQKNTPVKATTEPTPVGDAKHG